MRPRSRQSENLQQPPRRERARLFGRGARVTLTDDSPSDLDRPLLIETPLLAARGALAVFFLHECDIDYILCTVLTVLFFRFGKFGARCARHRLSVSNFA